MFICRRAVNVLPSIFSRNFVRSNLKSSTHFSQPPRIKSLYTTSCIQLSTQSPEKSDKKLEFVAETRQLLEIVANSLYSDKEVFLRELISNSSDALDRLRYLQVAGNEIQNPDIPLQIKISTSGSELIIEDAGVGMNYDEMIEYLGTIAKSNSKSFLQEMEKRGDSKVAENVIGRFGVGFYSAFMVCDLVEVFSRSWEVGSKCYRWASTGVGGYEIAEASGKHSENLRGTKLVLHLNASGEEFSKDDRIKSIITRYSNFVQFPIFLSGEKVNLQDPIWLKDPKDASSEETEEFYKFLSGDSFAPMYTFHFKLDMPISINAIFYVPSLKVLSVIANPSDPLPKVSIYSRRVLIQHLNKEFLPAWMRFIIGVVDSEDLSLNLSRELLQNSSLISMMKQIITSRLLRGLEAELERDKSQFALFFRCMGLYIREGIMYSESRTKEELASLILFESSKEPVGTELSLNEYIKKMRSDQKKIFYSSSPNRSAAENSPYAENLVGKDIEILYSYSQFEDATMYDLGKFKGNEIISIEDHASKVMKEDRSSGGKGLKDFTNWFENILGKDKVKHVKTSISLKKQPAMLIMSKLTRSRSVLINDPDLSTTNLAWDKISPTLHLNPNHQLVRRLDILRKKDPELACLIAEQIYYNSLVAAGLVKDARFMLPHLNMLLEKCIESHTQSSILTPQ